VQRRNLMATVMKKPEGRQPSMAQGPWLKDGLLALLLLPVPE